MASNSKHVPQVNAQGSDVGASFAGDPEDHKLPLIVILYQLGLIDAANSELAFHGRYQGRPLEESACSKLTDLRLSPSLHSKLHKGFADLGLSTLSSTSVCCACLSFHSCS